MKTLATAGALALALLTSITGPTFAPGLVFQSTVSQNLYRIEKIGGANIAYREAGDPNKPTVLLHGFPTSSHMFRNLIPELAKSYHVIAPDYPGFGASDMPQAKDFEYSFANIANIVTELLDRKESSLPDGLRRTRRLPHVRQTPRTAYLREPIPITFPRFFNVHSELSKTNSNR